MTPSRLLRSIAAVAIAAAVAAGSLEVLAARQSTPAGDARIVSPHDLDHPFAFTPMFKTREAWLARREALRKQILVALGLWPLPARTPLAPVIHGRIMRDGYSIEKVFFASYPGHYVSGNLYRPTGRAGRHPAVLSPHGHWENGRFLERSEKDAQALIDKGAERTIEAARYPLQARAANLARLGFVVFHYDMVGYADSKPLVHRQGFADAEALLRLQSHIGLQTWNSIRALDFLVSLPDVDGTRLAVTGESGGGTQTMMLLATDDRIGTAFPSVMVSGAMQGGCVCENAPLLRIGTNNIEIAALLAPKPLAMSAANDWTRDLFMLGLPELKAIYRLFDEEDRVTARFMPFEHGDHLPSRELMYNWFTSHLRPAGASRGPIVEPPFTPVPPSEISVFDADHPRPADTKDVVELRRSLAVMSDEQMTALMREPARYRETVATALHAIVNDPLATDVEATVADSTTGSSVRVSHARLSRKGSGDNVPVTILRPTDWNAGTVVVWAHPDGGRSLFETDGITPTAVANRLLTGGAMVMAPDVFVADASARPRVKNEETFPAFYYGYNRAVLAERARDLLTTVAFAKSRQARTVHVVGFGGAGVWGLLARALAGDAITRASLDLDGFNFADVRDPFDPMMLPGALKYGGIGAWLALCTSGQTEVYRAAGPPLPDRLKPAGLMLRDSSIDPENMARWVLGQP